jgi:uncharacterized damage-inducible protein DinB
VVETLLPIRMQFGETCDALRQALAALPDERLLWQPAPEASSVATMLQDIARTSEVYAYLIEHGEWGPSTELEERPSRERLLERLTESERGVYEAFERMTPERLRQKRADRWWAFGKPAEGPLDALWFAMEIVRHASYHLGQINLYRSLLEGERSP